MKIPTFISVSTQALPNWKAAFPNLIHICGLPAKFDQFDDSIIFLDFMNLPQTEKMKWFKFCVASQRKVFVLSPTPNVSEALSVIKNGAVGYGHSLASESRLHEMAIVVQYGGLWLGAKLIKRVMAALSVSSSDDKASSIDVFAKVLTDREFSVARHVATGASNTEISSVLNITERTVKAHISSIFTKLGVKNRVELALMLNNVQQTPLSMVK